MAKRNMAIRIVANNDKFTIYLFILELEIDKLSLFPSLSNTK